jgi:hypothetical protein
MAQIVGPTPNRRPTRPPAVAVCQRAAPPASVALPIDGTSRGHLLVVTRGAASEVVISMYLSGAAFAHSGFRARAVDRPSQGRWVGRGGRVCWGQAPEQCRSARPRVKSSGPQRVPPEPSATGAADVRYTPCRAPASSATHGPAQASQPRPWQHREALRATLRLIPLLLGADGDGMTRGEDEPEPSNSEDLWVGVSCDLLIAF